METARVVNKLRLSEPFFAVLSCVGLKGSGKSLNRRVNVRFETVFNMTDFIFHFGRPEHLLNRFFSGIKRVEIVLITQSSNTQ